MRAARACRIVTDDHIIIARRLIAMQKSLSESMDYITLVANAAKATGADGLAFASLMLKEALDAWRIEMTAYTAKYLKEKNDATDRD